MVKNINVIMTYIQVDYQQLSVDMENYLQYIHKQRICNNITDSIARLTREQMTFYNVWSYRLVHNTGDLRAEVQNTHTIHVKDHL